MKSLNRIRPIAEPENSADRTREAAQALVDDVEDYLLSLSQPYLRKANGFSPSATNECARRFCYLLEGVEIIPDVGGQLRRIFDNGDGVHERIVKYFREADVLISTEERILSEPVPISGYIDAIVEIWEIPFIVEIKSINERGFEARKQMRKPKDDHYKQIQLYMHVRGIHQGLVWYENKNTQEWLVLLVEYNQKYVEDIMERYGRIYDVHLAGEIPRRPHRQTSKICQGCDVKERCWSDDREGTEKL